MAYRNILDLIRLNRSFTQPVLYFHNSSRCEWALTYEDIWQEASQVAALVSTKTFSSPYVYLCLENGPRMIFAYFGAMMAGKVPVVVPRSQALEKIMGEDTYSLIIGENQTWSFLKKFKEKKAPRHLHLINLSQKVRMSTLASMPTANIYENEDLCSVHWASATHRRVEMQHGELLIQLEQISGLYAFSENPSHRMATCASPSSEAGLIINLLLALYSRTPVNFYSREQFLADPFQFVQWLSKHRFSILAAADQDYRQMVEKVDASLIKNIDLSQLIMAASYGDAIKPECGRRFNNLYKPWGLRPDAYMPFFGLTTAGVVIACSPRGRRFKSVNLDSSLLRQGKAQGATDKKEALEMLSYGHALPGCELRVINGHNQVLAEELVGEIQFRSPLTKKSASEPQWQDAGYVGFLSGGELFPICETSQVYQMKSELNYGFEVEARLADIKKIRGEKSAVVCIEESKGGQEHFAVIIESADAWPWLRSQQKKQIMKNLVERARLHSLEIQFVPRGTIEAAIHGGVDRRQAVQQKFCEQAKRLDKHFIFFNIAQRLQRASDSVSEAFNTSWTGSLKVKTGRVLTTGPSLRSMNEVETSVEKTHLDAEQI